MVRAKEVGFFRSQVTLCLCMAVLLALGPGGRKGLSPALNSLCSLRSKAPLGPEVQTSPEHAFGFSLPTELAPAFSVPGQITQVGSAGPSDLSRPVTATLCAGVLFANKKKGLGEATKEKGL